MFFAILMSDGALTALPPKKRLPVKPGMTMSENGESDEESHGTAFSTELSLSSQPSGEIPASWSHPPSDRVVAVLLVFGYSCGIFPAN